MIFTLKIISFLHFGKISKCFTQELITINYQMWYFLFTFLENKTFNSTTYHYSLTLIQDCVLFRALLLKPRNLTLGCANVKLFHHAFSRFFANNTGLFFLQMTPV